MIDRGQTVARFRDQLRAEGLDPYSVGWEGVYDGQFRDGYLIGDRLGGTVQVSTWERGRSHPDREFNSAEEALAYVLASLRRERSEGSAASPSPTPTPAQRQAQRELGRAMTERALAALAKRDAERAATRAIERPTDHEFLRAAVAAAGHPRDALVIVEIPDDSDAEREVIAPLGRWVIVSQGATLTVGAVGRGGFRKLNTMHTRQDTLIYVLPLLRPSEAPVMEMTTEEFLARGRATADGIRARHASNTYHRALLAIGDTVDCLGEETEHHLFAGGTPFPERAQPPSEAALPTRRYIVARPLIVGARERIAEPAFAQPGGGAMLVLDRPLRWYVDEGFLRRLVPPPEG